MLKEKSNADYARQINAFWGAEVVRLERRTETGRDKNNQPWSLTYDAIVSDFDWAYGKPAQRSMHAADVQPVF